MVPPSLSPLFTSLLTLPHRGSATSYERAAFHLVKDFLLKQGIRVTLKEFPCPRSYGWELFAICIVMGLGGVILSLPLVIIGTVWFILYFSGIGTPWDRGFAWGRSHNLLAEIGNGTNTLILLAHLDSAKTAPIFHPRWVRFFRVQFLLKSTLVVGLFAFTLLSLSPLTKILGIFFLLEGGLWLYREFTAPYVQGANDNLSGVIASVALFLKFRDDPLPKTRILLLITGGEEVGMRGARFFLKHSPPPPGTVVLNLDNVGAGELYAILGEGMLWVTPYPGTLANKIAPLKLPTHTYRLAYFDALPFARRGYETLTLIRMKGGVPPHWHWLTDTQENLEQKAIPETIACAEQLILERFS